MTAYDLLTWAAILTAALLQLVFLVGVAWLIVRLVRAPRRRRAAIRARLDTLIETDMHPNLDRATARIDTRAGTDHDTLDTCNTIWNTAKEDTK